MLNTVAMADDYFSDNFFGYEYWSALTDQQKQVLIATAEIDIAVALRSELDPAVVVHTEKPYTPVQMAVFEWALYLHKNKDRLAKKLHSTTAGLASIEVDGVGKETYATSSGHGDTQYMRCLWGSRAGQFLSLIEQDVRIIR